jgi:hypothetical protein
MLITEHDGGTIRFSTPEETRGTREVTGQTSTRGDRPKKRRDATYLVRVRPVVETLPGNMELILVETAACRQGGLEEEMRASGPCPAIIKLVTDMQEYMAKALIGKRVIAKEQARAEFNKLNWMADKRKTKADTK